MDDKLGCLDVKQELKTMTKYFENIYTKCHQKLKTSLTFNQNCKNEIISRQKLNPDGTCDAGPLGLPKPCAMINLVTG